MPANDADFTYYNDQELPVATFDLSALGEDFSTGWTFSVRLCRLSAPTTTLLLKTTGITSTATTVTVAWSTTDWSGLPAALPPQGTKYVGYLYARRTADSKDLERDPTRAFTLKLMAAAGTTATPGTATPIYAADHISVSDAGGYYDSTDVEGALQEAGADLAAHLADTVDAHDASAISVADAGGYYTGSTVEAVLAELPTTYTRPRGNTCIIIGDSVAAGSDLPSSELYGQSTFSRLCAASGQRLQLLYNAGVSGNTSTQMLARIATDVIAREPQWCIIAGVTPNDVSGAIALATRKANIEAMVLACRVAGIGVILATSCPSDTTSTRDSLLAMNAWLAGYAQANGIPLLDWYSPVVDTSDSTYNSSYTGDGTHPNTTGQDVIAVACAATVAEFITRPTAHLFTVGISDAANLITNGVFVGDTNVDGLANNWTEVGSGITSQQLVAMTASEGLGNWQELTSNGTLGYIEQSVSTGFSVGDVLEFSGRWYSATAANVVNYAQLNFVGPSTNSRFYIPTNTASPRAWSQRVTVPSGTTSIQVRPCVMATTATVMRVGQVTLRNLTTLGVV